MTDSKHTVSSLAKGQVYVTPSGTKHHPLWCAVLASKDPSAVLIIAEGDVGGRELCQFCLAEAEYDAYLGTATLS